MSCTVSRLKSVLRYPGAKWTLAPWIVSHMPMHDTYVEPFAGSCAVLLTKPPASHELVNDLHGDVVNLFRVIRDQPADLAAKLCLTPYAREEFEASFHIDPAADPVERARLFMVRIWMAHAGKMGSRAGWRLWREGTDRADQMPDLWAALPQRVWAVVERLQHVHIEHRPAIEIIALYARTDALIYCDPPYVRSTLGTDRMYVHDMTDDNHTAMLDALDRHRGPVLVSGYRSPLYDDRLVGWTRIDTRGRAYRGAERVESLWLNPVAVASQRQYRMDLPDIMTGEST